MFLTYGRDKLDNLVHISEAPAGNACGLACPFCGLPLTARKGAVLAHHFAHQSDSCRSIWSSGDEFIPSYEGYYLFGLTKPQQRALHELITTHQGRTFYADTLRRVTFESLSRKHFLVSVRQQPDERDQIRLVIRITEKARAFAGQLTLLEFACFMRAEFARALQVLQAKAAEHDYQIALNLLNQELKRIEQTALYFLGITAGGQPLYKIGVTARPLAERIQEVKTFLGQHFAEVTITPLFHVAHVPYVEGYFKAKYAGQLLKLGQATEYFTFTQELSHIQAELHALSQASLVGFPAEPPATQTERAQAEPHARFRATFERYDRKQNRFTGWYEEVLLLVDLVNLGTGEHLADWQWFTLGKTFQRLGILQPGDLLEFNAVCEAGKLKWARQVVKV